MGEGALYRVSCLMEPRHFLRRALAAYAVGALLGTLPLFLDWAFRGGAVNHRSLAGFSLLGGLAAGVPALLMVARWGGKRWREPTICVLACFLTLEVLYLINVALLPNDGALSARSLLWDLVAFGPPIAGTWLAFRTQDRLPPMLGGRILPFVGSALLVGAALVVAGTWPVEPVIPRRQGDGPNLVVIVVDAARRDHLGLYGYARATSPSIDACRSRARVYHRALAASSWTLNSVPALFGSSNGDPAAHPVLDALKARGYVVACFSDNPLFEREGPLSSGFDHVAQSTGAVPRMLRALFAETFIGEFVVMWPWLAMKWDDRSLVDKALRWSSHAEGPFLLYVHLMDAHMPYRRPAIDGRGWRHRRLLSPTSGMKASPEEAEDIVAHYDGGIRSADDAAGRVLKAVGEWGRPYVAIVTADHGESLGEGSRWGHGKTLAPELLDVPLLVMGDGVRPGRVDAPVGHASVAETLLLAAGLPGAVRLRASDLRTGSGDIVVEGGLPPALSYRVSGGYQVVTNRSTGEARLFDLREGGRREDDVSRLHPTVLLELTRESLRETPALVDEGVRERLRALGYIDE